MRGIAPVRGRVLGAARAPHLISLLLTVATAGCGIPEMVTGDVMTGYTVEEFTPYLLESHDLDMACEAAVSLGAFLLSFERVVDRPNKAGVVAYVTAGSCTEVQAWEAELTHLRAVKGGVIAAHEATDARFYQRRLHARAARRFYESWQRLGLAYGDPGGRCPQLEEEVDPAIYLLGLIAGLKAVQHDRAASGLAGVPLDVPAAVARAADCLDDDQWWGVPAAMKAAVWTSVPGTTPDGTDPWAVLEAAAAKGEAAGVRLAGAIRAQAAADAGHVELARASITAVAKAQSEKQAPKKWGLLDENATLIALAVSDRLWTSETGHRTPPGELGNFWEVDEGDGDDDEGLFDDLDEPPPTATPVSPSISKKNAGGAAGAPGENPQ